MVANANLCSPPGFTVIVAVANMVGVLTSAAVRIAEPAVIASKVVDTPTVGEKVPRFSERPHVAVWYPAGMPRSSPSA